MKRNPCLKKAECHINVVQSFLEKILCVFISSYQRIKLILKVLHLFSLALTLLWLVDNGDAQGFKKLCWFCSPGCLTALLATVVCLCIQRESIKYTSWVFNLTKMEGVFNSISFRSQPNTHFLGAELTQKRK